MLSYTLSTIICNIYFHIYEHIIVYVITYIDTTLLSSYHILHWHDTLSLWINGYITIVTSTYHCERITYHPDSTVTSTSTSTNHYRGRISCHPDQRLHLDHPGGPQLRFLSIQRSTVQLDSSLSFVPSLWDLFLLHHCANSWNSLALYSALYSALYPELALYPEFGIYYSLFIYVHSLKLTQSLSYFCWLINASLLVHHGEWRGYTVFAVLVHNAL